MKIWIVFNKCIIYKIMDKVEENNEVSSVISKPLPSIELKRWGEEPLLATCKQVWGWATLTGAVPFDQDTHIAQGEPLRRRTRQ